MPSFIINILLFLLVIGILTFVHELGHFLAAKAVGAKVFEFALGFGPKLISKKIGETEYSIRILPFGGYVKILGDGDPGKEEIKKEDKGRDLSKKPKWQQIIVMLAGVTMNIILGVTIYYIVLFSNGWELILNNEFADFGHPAENYFLSEQLPDDFVESKEVQKKVVNYFSAFDPSIIGFEVETLETSDDKESSKVRIDAVHKMIDSNKTATIPLKLESAGTLKMFALYPMLQAVLESGGVLFVDELNARLHPLLVRSFIITFLNPETNKKHAQLIFTSHDSWQLNSNSLRRDEVWFTEKDNAGVSTLYSLADFVDEDGVKIRKDENYEKNYLLGKYGAIPTMKHFDMFKGE